MKKTYDIKTIIEKCQLDFEKKLQNIVNGYENRNYEVEIQYSISRDINLGAVYSALVIAYANYNRSGCRIDR